MVRIISTLRHDKYQAISEKLCFSVVLFTPQSSPFFEGQLHHGRIFINGKLYRFVAERVSLQEFFSYGSHFSKHSQGRDQQ